MVSQRVPKMWPMFGILLYVMLGVFFGSIWYAALSFVMTTIER